MALVAGIFGEFLRSDFGYGAFDEAIVNFAPDFRRILLKRERK